MYHPPSKQRQIIKHVLVYSLMTLSVLTIVSLALLYMLGYRFDSNGSTVEQSGLVQFDSQPSGAMVSVDGQVMGSKTDSKETVASGQHQFEMSRTGYESWQKQLSISAGTLTWLNYARLVPVERPQHAVTVLSALDDGLASPDDKRFALLQDDTKARLTLYDLTKNLPSPTTITLPSDSLGKITTGQRFQLISWDKDGRYVIVKRVISKQTQWLVVDTKNSDRTVNVTAALDIPIEKLEFSDTSGSSLVALSDGDIRTINLNSGTISSPVVSDVASFSLYDDEVISYITTINKKSNHRSAGIVKIGQSPVVLAISSSAKELFSIAASHYFHNDFIAVSQGKTTTIFKGDFPSRQTDSDQLVKYASFDFVKPVQWLQLSPGGRFIVMQNGDQFMSYDLERDEASQAQMLPGKTKARQLEWLDPYHVWSDRSGGLSMSEFDGANRAELGSVATDFDATLSPSGKYLYSIGKAQSGYQFQRILMILP